MRECCEKVIKLGFKRDPKKICDEIEMASAGMIRDGWFLKDSLVEEGLANIHLFFERALDEQLSN